ncbi:hypothetical protein VU01_12352 [Candidatus Electrothrix marina]|uniref:Uncharacterized protein n=1 Tax=Candidatus Electrothrix marina TaxID=1859130 RepID=A0A444JD40_9BACT|nr:hypothetical protein VU01_12352 [Candidatus Electrothrix marina]
MDIINPKSEPFEWLASDLGAGEIAAMALALENPSRIVLLDDMLARRTRTGSRIAGLGNLKDLAGGKISRPDKYGRALCKEVERGRHVDFR